MIKKLIKYINDWRAYRRFRSLQADRATSVAVNMALTGALRRLP